MCLVCDTTLFSDHKQMYQTIDNTELSDVKWQLFVVKYTGDQGVDPAPWMNDHYDVWFRDPREVVRNMLANPNFADDMDYWPFREYDTKTSTRHWQDFMSGDWAWRLLRFHGFANACFPFWIVTLMDAMRSMDVSTSRATCSRTYHMLPVRLLVCSLFHFMCFFTVLLWIVDSSMLTILSYAYPIRLVDSSAYSLFPDSWLIYFLCLFVLVSRSLVYIRLGMRTCSSSSIYFATTLQVRPARSHILSLSLIAHWPRLLLCDLLKGVNSPFSVISLTSSEVQPTHVLRYARNSVKRWV